MNIDNWHPIAFHKDHLARRGWGSISETVNGELKPVTFEELVARYNWLLTEYRNRPAHDEAIIDDAERDGVGDA
jgi:hypothetical protein